MQSSRAIVNLMCSLEPGLSVVRLNCDFFDSGIYRIGKSGESLNPINPGSDNCVNNRKTLHRILDGWRSLAYNRASAATPVFGLF